MRIDVQRHAARAEPAVVLKQRQHRLCAARNDHVVVAGQAPPVSPEGLPAEGSPAAALLAALCDDLNTPKALGILWSALRNEDLAPAEKIRLAAFAEELLSLGVFDFTRVEAEEHSRAEKAPPEVASLAAQRWAAREEKDFAESDRLRDELAARGYTVRDRKDGYDLVRNS